MCSGVASLGLSRVWVPFSPLLFTAAATAAAAVGAGRAAAPHLPAVQAHGGLLHRHAAQQAVAAEGVARVTLPAGALAQPHALLLARRQPRRPQEEAGAHQEQPPVSSASPAQPYPLTPPQPASQARPSLVLRT